MKDLSLPFCHLRKRLLNGPGTYLLYCVSSGPGACHPALLCSYFPVSPEHAGSYQHFETEDETQCVGPPPTHQKVGMLAVCFSLLFLSPGRSWKLGLFSPIMPHWAGGRWWWKDYGEWMPWIFLPTLMCLLLHLPGVQEPLPWVLDLLQGKLAHVLILSQSSRWGGRRKF